MRTYSVSESTRRQREWENKVAAIFRDEAWSCVYCGEKTTQCVYAAVDGGSPCGA